MPVQLSLAFDEVPITCPVQERYHAIGPCLAGQRSPADQAQVLNLSYATVCRWLRQFRQGGLPGLHLRAPHAREPYTPERVIVTVLYFKCCAPKASDRELARVVAQATGHPLHHETVNALLQRYFFWHYPEFRNRIQYPVPIDPVARLGEYRWERCGRIEEAVQFHQQLIRDHNRLPHFAHRQRQDEKKTPLEVLGANRGRTIEPADLHRAFARMSWQRRTDARGFVRINRWKIYVEEGLPQTPVQVTYWDGKLRAEYQSHLLTEYRCRWDGARQRPKSISQPKAQEHPFHSRQSALFDPLWIRHPVQMDRPTETPKKQATAGGQQLRFYLGPELVR